MRRAASPGSLARRTVAYEWAMWTSLFRWVLRRPANHRPGGEVFSYLGVVRPILIAFIALSAVEIPIFDLIISRLVPWQPARFIALALGAYGLIWMLGLVAMIQLRPHIVDGTGIRVRNGIKLDLTIPWEGIAAVHGRYRSLPTSKAVQLEAHRDGLIVNLGVAGQTSVEVALREPTSLALPNGRREPAVRVRLYADDPGGFVASARAHLARQR